MAKYRLKEGKHPHTHYIPNIGKQSEQRLIVQPGETCDLTEAQVAAWKDKFDPVVEPTL
mgnify:CR=1 FL=1